LYFSAYFSR